MRRVNLADPEFTYDADEPEGFRAGVYRWGPDVGATATGTSLYEIPPGQAICPYHWEVGEEEWLLVLAGRPTLRTPDGETQLDPLDSVFFPTTPEGAHAVRNDTGEVCRVLMYSEIRDPAVCIYPDSDKVGVFAKGKPGVDGQFPRSAKVGYYYGEVEGQS